MRTSDGETRTVLAHLTKLSMPPAGSRILAQLVDVTDRRAILDNLERLVRSKDRLVRSVSHELRTPLTAVVGFAEELEDRTDIDNDERRDLLSVIAQQSREMADLIEDLLAAATADGGTLSVRPVVMDVVAVCREVIAAWRGSAPRLEVEASPGPAHADPFRVRQILRNLLTNAERYGETPIDLVVANGSTTVRLQVRDRGPGLPTDAWESIFEPYQRAHEENQHGGVGLGLSVSRQLARAMQGDLAYRVEDGLSVFELSLPAAP
jgi:signal transduction histidine kinase